MLEHIGSAGTEAMAWAERNIVSFNLQAKRGESIEKITQRLRPLFAVGQRLDVSTRRQMETFRAPASLARTHSHAGAVLPAPAKNRTLTKDQESKEERAKVSEQRAAKTLAEKGSESIPQIKASEIADRVYRLMQHDLILERERLPKLGG